VFKKYDKICLPIKVITRLLAACSVKTKKCPVRAKKINRFEQNLMTGKTNVPVRLPGYKILSAAIPKWIMIFLNCG